MNARIVCTYASATAMTKMTAKEKYISSSVVIVLVSTTSKCYFWDASHHEGRVPRQGT